MSARACLRAAFASSVSCCVAAISRSTDACCRRRDCTKMDSHKGTFTLLTSMPCSSLLCSAYRIATCVVRHNLVKHSVDVAHALPVWLFGRHNRTWRMSRRVSHEAVQSMCQVMHICHVCNGLSISAAAYAKVSVDRCRERLM